jgi:4-aminobutyrate aminotransferase-like enzyme
MRAKLLEDMRTKQLLALNSGERSIRFRMPLVVTEAEIDLALDRIAACIPSTARVQSVRK